MKYIDLTGMRFGRLTVIGRAPTRLHGGQKKVFFRCLCDCGNIRETITSSLRAGITKSCGCLSKETNKRTGKAKKGIPCYSIRTGLKYVTGVYYRCVKCGAKNRNLEFSITIEDMEDLLIKQNFKCKLSGLDIVIGYGIEKHEKTASLDRIDSSKGYTKDNIQWVHKKINWMKYNFSETEFIELCKKVYLHSFIEGSIS